MAESVAVFRSPQPHIRRVPVDRPWVWLGQGWHDMAKAPKLSLGLGAASVVAGWLAFSLLVFYDLPFLDDRSRRNILGYNAARVFNLEIPAKYRQPHNEAAE